MCDFMDCEKWKELDCSQFRADIFLRPTCYRPLIAKTDPVGESPACNDRVISDADTLKVINTAIGTATSIINMTDNKHVQEMAANIADTLIALTSVESLQLK